MEMLEIVLRLGAATLVGAALGLNRDLHHKPTGVRTLGLVGLGAGAVVMAAIGTGDAGAASRVIQGIVTGIGFLGAGVIIRTEEDHRIHGLTTAACTWLAACLGAACGVGNRRVVLVSVPLVFAVLTFGGALERALRPYLREPEDD
jgi:putative Mg2+ transporter-C (MgtC) family protein